MSWTCLRTSGISLQQARAVSSVCTINTQKKDNKFMNEIVKLRKRNFLWWKWAQRTVRSLKKSFYHHYENFLFPLSLTSSTSTLKYSKQKTKFIMFRLLLLLMCLRQERFFLVLCVHINLYGERDEN